MNDDIKWGIKVNVFELSGCHIVSGHFLEFDEKTNMYWVSSEGHEYAYEADKYNVVKFGDPKPASVVKGDELPLKLVSKRDDEMETGDVFLWRNSRGEFSVHTFHSHAGYGAKTYTDFDEVDGSSLLVNWSGICGVLETVNE